MRVREIEDTVWRVEGIRIAIRAGIKEEVGGYGFVNAAPAGRSWQWLKDNRIAPLIGDKEVVAISGTGTKVNGNMLLSRIRASYDT